MPHGLFWSRYVGAVLPIALVALAASGCGHQRVETPRSTPAPPSGPVGPVVPKPAVDLVPGVSRYAAAVVAGDQRFQVEATRTIEDVDGSWLVTERVKPPTGSEGIETATLEKGTLIVRGRKVDQGPIQAEFEFRNGKASGQAGMGGAPVPVSVELGGELFADGAGAWPSLASLPLEEGYSLLYRVFDIQSQREERRKASVAGSEEVVVPAGRFACWRVEIVSAGEVPGKTTIWVAKESRKIVRSEAIFPTGTRVEAELK